MLPGLGCPRECTKGTRQVAGTANLPYGATLNWASILDGQAFQYLQHASSITLQDLSAGRRDLIERAGAVLLDHFFDFHQAPLGQSACLDGQISSTEPCRIQQEHEVRLLDCRQVYKQQQAGWLMDERQQIIIKHRWTLRLIRALGRDENAGNARVAEDRQP